MDNLFSREINTLKYNLEVGLLPSGGELWIDMPIDF